MALISINILARTLAACTHAASVAPVRQHQATPKPKRQREQPLSRSLLPRRQQAPTTHWRPTCFPKRPTLPQSLTNGCVMLSTCSTPGRASGMAGRPRLKYYQSVLVLRLLIEFSYLINQTGLLSFATHSSPPDSAPPQTPCSHAGDRASIPRPLSRSAQGRR